MSLSAILVPLVVGAVGALVGFLGLVLTRYFDKRVVAALTAEQADVDRRVVQALERERPKVGKLVLQTLEEDERAAFGRAVIEIGLGENIGEWRRLGYEHFPELVSGAKLAQDSGRLLASLQGAVEETHRMVERTVAPLAMMPANVEHLTTTLEGFRTDLRDTMAKFEPWMVKLVRLEERVDGGVVAIAAPARRRRARRKARKEED